MGQVYIMLLSVLSAHEWALQWWAIRQNYYRCYSFQTLIQPVKTVLSLWLGKSVVGLIYFKLRLIHVEKEKELLHIYFLPVKWVISPNFVESVCVREILCVQLFLCTSVLLLLNKNITFHKACSIFCWKWASVLCMALEKIPISYTEWVFFSF